MANMVTTAPAKGAEIELTIEKLAFGGQALGRYEGLVVFVDHGLPGQRLRVRLRKKKATFAEAEVVEVLAPSPQYVPPRCRHFGLCGGCRWQDLAYEAQLDWKRQQVLECLAQLGGVRPEDVAPTTPSPEIWYYRNKMEFTFAPRPWLPAAALAAGVDPEAMGAALGLHVPGSFHRVFDVAECYLQSPQTGPILALIRQVARESGLPAYDTRRQTGFWRFVVLREGKRTGEQLLWLITTGQGDNRAVDRLAAALRQEFPALTTMVHAVSDKKAQVAQADRGRVLWGPGYLEEELGGRRFRISPGSFFQTNTAAAEGLYHAVGRLAGLTGRETVWDLYCGAGSIALSLAHQARRVVGFELVAAAIQDAYVNANLNGVDNCQFIAGDLKDCLRQVSRSPHYARPDVIITDPPRAGMHPQVIQAILELAPARLIAVSCNPATLARDLALLQPQYEVANVAPVDLFPHTPHIECVVGLERRATL
jgi:23S rRNA (uracil1939-C5)-methyltransferase